MEAHVFKSRFSQMICQCDPIRKQKRLCDIEVYSVLHNLWHLVSYLSLYRVYFMLFFLKLVRNCWGYTWTLEVIFSCCCNMNFANVEYVNAAKGFIEWESVSQKLTGFDCYPVIKQVLLQHFYSSVSSILILLLYVWMFIFMIKYKESYGGIFIW